MTYFSPLRVETIYYENIRMKSGRNLLLFYIDNQFETRIS